MFYTSYFYNVKNIPDDITCVSIALSPPAWYSGFVYKTLAPSWDILKEYKSNYDEVSYTKRFEKEILSHLNVDQVAHDLRMMSDNGNVCLLCFEGKGAFCHRHLVSDWLNSHGYACEEI